jgi:hypothetical protein
MNLAPNPTPIERLQSVSGQMKQLQQDLRTRPYLDVERVKRLVRERLAQVYR